MKSQSNDGAFLQCQTCGEIFQVDRKYGFDIMYIRSYCPQCKKAKVVLNLGEDAQDLYIYYNANLSRRDYNDN